MNGYELSRIWFDWCFLNPDKISPNHSALYFFCIEHCNRLGWKDKFGLPTTMAMEALGIKSYKTYINTLKDLTDYGFIKMIEVSKNQYSSNIVALVNFTKALDKALDKAMLKHVSKQVQIKDSIDKPITLNIEHNVRAEQFEIFWKFYPKKVAKSKCKLKFMKLKDSEVKEISKTIIAYVAYKPFESYTHPNPETYLNQRRWEDEVPKNNPKNNPTGVEINLALN